MITAIDSMAYQCTHTTHLCILLGYLISFTTHMQLKTKNVLLTLIIYFFFVYSTSSLLTQKTKVLYNTVPLKPHWAIQSSSYSQNSISLWTIQYYLHSNCSNNLNFFLHMIPYTCKDTLSACQTPQAGGPTPVTVASSCCPIISLHTQHNVTTQFYNMDKIMIFMLITLGFSLTSSFQLHYGLGVDSSSNRNEYQKHFLGCKGSLCVWLTTVPPSHTDCLKIREPQPPGTLKGCPGL